MKKAKFEHFSILLKMLLLLYWSTYNKPLTMEEENNLPQRWKYWLLR